MEIYENTVGVHTFELNLRLSGFDEYRERAAQLYDEASDILNESGKRCMATEKWNDLRLSNLWNSVAARKGGFRLAQIGGISTEFTWRSESVWNHKKLLRKWQNN